MPEAAELPKVHLAFSPTIGALAVALAKAQSTLASAPKNHTAEVTMKSGGKYTYSYADLAGVWDAGRAPLTAAGLSVVQAPTLTPAGLTMTTVLLHSSGEWVRGDMEGFPVPDRTPQGVGTSITYARRYTLGAMIGAVSEEDDDGGNGGRPKAKRESQRDQAVGGGSRPEASSGAPTNFPNFGKGNGAPIRDAALAVLEFHLEAARKSLANPDKAKFHAKESALIGAIEAELARQRGAAKPEGQRETAPAEKPARVVDQKPDESEEHAKQRQAGVFYAKAVKAGANAGWEQADVGKWLRENRKCGGKSEVTAADAEAFCHHLEPPPEPGAAG